MQVSNLLYNRHQPLKIIIYLVVQEKIELTFHCRLSVGKIIFKMVMDQNQIL